MQSEAGQDGADQSADVEKILNPGQKPLRTVCRQVIGGRQAVIS